MLESLIFSGVRERGPGKGLGHWNGVSEKCLKMAFLGWARMWSPGSGLPTSLPQDIFVGLRSYGRVGNRGRCGSGPPLPCLCRLNEVGAFHAGCVLSPEASLTIVNASSHPTPQHWCVLKCLQVILSPNTLFSCPTFFPGHRQSRLGSSLPGVPMLAQSH